MIQATWDVKLAWKQAEVSHLANELSVYAMTHTKEQTKKAFELLYTEMARVIEVNAS